MESQASIFFWYWFKVGFVCALGLTAYVITICVLGFVIVCVVKQIR